MKVEIKQVTKQFKEKTAVDSFSMTIESGECVGLIGPNGAGKSTLIKMISNISDPSSGEIFLDGKPISSQKKEIGYLPQYPNFFSWMTAKETLFFMGELSGLTKDELTSIIPTILSKVGLNGEENRKVRTFSGGMKQRLGIAQALLHKPSLIIMDEPVSALDPIGRREVLNIIEEIKKETTILLSTHILNDAEEICERFVMIKNGKKIEDTTLSDLLNRHNQHKISFELTTKNDQWITLIEQLPYVKNIESIGKKVKIEVEDIENNKTLLLAHALEHQISFVKFEVNHDSLEEIFLKLVVEK